MAAGNGVVAQAGTSTSPDLISLTKLYHPPTQNKVHPKADQIIKEVQTWLAPYVEPLGAEKVINKIIDQTTSMCLYLYPEADDEGVFLAAAFMTVQFVNDDTFDSAAILTMVKASSSGQKLAADLQKLRENPKRLAEGIMGAARIIQNPDAYHQCLEMISDFSVDPFLFGALWDLSKRMHARGRRINEERFERWLGKFFASMTDFGKSHALIYSEAKGMTVEEYADHKLLNSGMIYTVLFVEMAVGYLLSEEQNALPEVRQLQQHCEKIGSLLNEIFSYEKETFQEDTNNLLAVLVKQENIKLGEAARRVAVMSQKHADEVKRIRNEIEASNVEASGDDALLHRYVKDMDLFGAACWFWQLEGTKRYCSKTSPFAELRLVDKAPVVETPPSVQSSDASQPKPKPKEQFLRRILAKISRRFASVGHSFKQTRVE